MSGYPVICDCGAEVWLRGFNGGYRGTCPNCNADVVYWCGEYVPEEPEPEDMHLLIRKEGENHSTWEFTNRARYAKWLADPSTHWTVTETGETVELREETYTVGIAHRTPTVMVRDGSELRGFSSSPEMRIWANRNYKTLKSGDLELYEGKLIHFYEVVN